MPPMRSAMVTSGNSRDRAARGSDEQPDRSEALAGETELAPRSKKREQQRLQQHAAIRQQQREQQDG